MLLISSFDQIIPRTLSVNRAGPIGSSALGEPVRALCGPSSSPTT